MLFKPGMASQDRVTIEAKRQQTIADYQLTSPFVEATFNNLTQLAASMFGVPISIISVLSSDRQFFRGSCGLSPFGTDRESAFCNHTVEQRAVMVVEDALKDPRFRDNRLVTGTPFIRFYAGAPIYVGDDVAIGSLCLLDTEPQSFSENDQQLLNRLARTVADVMEMRVGTLATAKINLAMRRQSDLFRATIDNVDHGIAVFDDSLQLVLWNQAFIDLLELDPGLARAGTSAGDFLAFSVARGDFGAGDRAQLTSDLLASVRSTPLRRLELDLPTGRIVSVRRASMDDGRSIMTVEDVTESRRVVRLKNEFVSTVSHELRTPLTSIRGSLALLGRGAERFDARDRQMLTMATKNTDRLCSLVDDILDIEKLGTGGLEFVMDRIDLSHLLDQACEQDRPYADTLGVAIELERPDAALFVDGDAGRLRQALTNLISNAAKFSHAGQVVTVSAIVDGPMVTVSVLDRGEGISNDFRPHVFRRFAQAAASQRGKPGTGLGLAITKAIVDAHDGKIDFETTIGEGSRFFITLPLAERPA